MAIDSHEGVLYGLVRLPNDETWLIAADPDQGTSMPLVELDGFVGICGPEHPLSMAFDPQGGLWVNIQEIIFGCIIITRADNAVLHFSEPLSGISDPRQHLLPDPDPFLVGMAVRTTETVIEVPATGRLGLLVLLTSLAFVGTFWLRNRLARGV